MAKSQATKHDDQPSHKHRWIPTLLRSEDKCECGMSRMTATEFNYRKELWEAYEEEVVNTPSYDRYKRMAEMVARKKHRTALCPTLLSDLKTHCTDCLAFMELRKEVDAAVATPKLTMGKPPFANPLKYEQYIDIIEGSGPEDVFFN